MNELVDEIKSLLSLVRNDEACVRITAVGDGGEVDLEINKDMKRLLTYTDYHACKSVVKHAREHLKALLSFCDLEKAKEYCEITISNSIFIYGMEDGPIYDRETFENTLFASEKLVIKVINLLKK